MRTAAVISFAILAALIVQANGNISTTTRFEDPVLQISFWLPNGFKEAPKNGPLQGRFTYMNPRGGIQFSIDGIDGRLPQASNFQLRGTIESDSGFPIRWNHLCLHAERSLEWHEGIDEPLVFYSVLLPVEPEAISVRMVGTEGIEPEMRALFHDFLEKIRGETEWDPEPSVCDQEEQTK